MKKLVINEYDSYRMKIPVLNGSIHLEFKIFELIKRLILNGNELRLIISLENLPISEYFLAVIVLIIYDSIVEKQTPQGAFIIQKS